MTSKVLASSTVQPPDASKATEPVFRDDVEGLRAIAVVLVVLYHAGVGWTKGGFVGVDVFFVISGFVITGVLVRELERTGSISFRNFYARRARRILPAGMVVIVATVLVAHHEQNFVTYALTAQDGRWAAAFAANVHFAIVGTDYFAQGQAPSPLLHYWSLAVEEQFYLVWPALIGLVALGSRRASVVRAAAAVVVVGSFIWSVSQTSSNPTWAYFSPFTRAWELAVGAVIATTVKSSTIAPRVGSAIATAGLVGIVLSAVIDNDASAFPGVPALLPVLGAAAVIVGGASGTGARYLLSLRPIRATGRVSYGWYLLHYPPMILLAGVLWRKPLPTDERLVIAIVTLAVAFVMFEILEKPILRSRVLAARPWTSIAIGIGFVVLAFGVSALVHKSF